MYSLKTFGLWLGFHKVWYFKKTPFNKMIRDHSGHGHSQWQIVLMFPIGCDHTKNYVWMNNSIFLRSGSNDRLPICWYLAFQWTFSHCSGSVGASVVAHGVALPLYRDCFLDLRLFNSPDLRRLVLCYCCQAWTLETVLGGNTALTRWWTARNIDADAKR